MRPFETILLIVLAINLVQLLRKETQNREFMLVHKIGWSTLLLNFFIEQFRWQMGPAYLLLLFLFFFRSKNSHAVIKIGFALLWMAAAFIPYAVPVISLPNPTGPYAVGSSTSHWVDTNRAEWFTKEDKEDLREIMVQFWYPTDKKPRRNRTPYIDHLEIRAKAMGDAGEIPSFLLTHIDLTKTNSTLNAKPIAKAAPFPLVIFSHGITGMRHIHTSLAENLASHGYVVAAPDHSYDANITIFPDGHIADYRSHITGHPDSVIIRRKQINTRTEDVRFIIEQFKRIQSGDISHPLTGYMDLENIGVAGHSFGGATAIQASKTTETIGACLVLDGWINPVPNSTIHSGIETPFFYIGRPHWNDSDYPDNYSHLKTLLGNNRGEQFHMTLKGTRHMDYSDTPLFSPFVSKVLETGTTDGNGVIKLTNRLSLEFFDQYLKKIPSPLLNKKDIEPELVFHEIS